jgi:hypothetical protein
MEPNLLQGPTNMTGVPTLPGRTQTSTSVHSSPADNVSSAITNAIQGASSGDHSRSLSSNAFFNTLTHRIGSASTLGAPLDRSAHTEMDSLLNSE